MSEEPTIDHWNYRVRQYVAPEGDTVVEFIEVYYDADDNIVLWTAEGVAPCGESWDDLDHDVEMMVDGLAKDTLFDGDLPGSQSSPVEVSRAIADTQLESTVPRG